jgi:hypothetical protein
MIMNRTFTSVSVPLFVTLLGAGTLGLSQSVLAQEDEALVACDDTEVRDRSRSSRRRSTAANRDCQYRETVVDQETG